MKKLSFILITALCLQGCKESKNTPEMQTDIQEEVVESMVSKEMMETAVIYEANIRQYSPEGSFDAFTKDIPELKKLGVKVIWVMPIFPISETKRKAFGDKFVSDIEDDEEKKKYLGSYYAVSDFRAINPEFGNLEDFRKLVKTAHEHGINVILDWVPNHTGWDHTWITEHPEFYTKNAKGEITDPLKEDGTPVGWADVADLNYDNQELRAKMLEDMMYWVVEENIDGFRCDMAGMVPIDFWEETIPKLRAQKDLFMLAEAWEPQLMRDNLFDMAYGWDRHHTMNDIAKGEKNAKDWDETLNRDFERYADDDILMNFVTNHDENSWAGSVSERMGDAAPLFTTLTYVIPGMPLIYSGQEYDMSHRLKFFEKDSIPKTKGKTWDLLVKLGELKNKEAAMNGGKNAASYTRIDKGNDNILCFQREKNGKKLMFIGNLSDDVQTIEEGIQGDYIEAFSGKSVKMDENSAKTSFKPWEFAVYLKK